MIALFDPSLLDNSGNVSTNLGDVIIYESVIEVLNERFPDQDIIRISTHCIPDIKYLNIAKSADLRIVGGSNLLSSNILKYNQWKLSTRTYDYIFPRIKDVVLLGVGWWQYQEDPDMITRWYYKKLLHREIFHSVRDKYTENKLKSFQLRNVVNTSCPTLWKLNGVNTNRKSTITNKCILTLTDYSKKIEYDQELIKTILDYYSNIIFFAQGSMDLNYLESLDIYNNNKSKFKIILSLEQFVEYLHNENTSFIGTRLHAGIKAMQAGLDTLIIGIDNRAIEIQKDTNIPVINRGDKIKLIKWIEGEKLFENVNICTDSINMWKKNLRG